MPIGDLLAEISGGQSFPAPPEKTSTSLGIKRKAEGDPPNTASAKYNKARQHDVPSSASRVARDVKKDDADRPRTAASVPARSSTLPHRTHSPSTNGRPYQPPTPNGQRITASSNGRPSSGPVSSTSQPKQPLIPASRPSKLNTASQPLSKPPPAKPSPTTPTPSDPSKAPKKGSFQEIMERAKKAQATMNKAGMIQHKPMDRRDRGSGKAEPKPNIVKGKSGKAYAGNGRTPANPSRDGARPAAGGREGGRNGTTKDAKVDSKQARGSPAGEVPEKKVKKSATATTGYTGTARPRPGASSDKPSSRKQVSSYRGGGLLAPPSRRDRYENEYDDDMDDFIEYDDDDEPDPRGNGYGYESDGSSDMEAGLSDIDVEERRAEILAREEDRREQALEEKLKREKEERRRRLAQG
ncbi:hypothetical protein GGS23DRAFT_85685 [Durotheca rogersii]|uniref:uncharacterized protein n=1 Tax=Durotheca rogersii TaxID=419775 RepID=UPI0022200C93|nr:uncharacterized protein GGS23DRAFT_85685 [Durotheca rogersii]KAI5862649.1 hypothetical protein GGS23DRAFT_85685 [Durotheca rogersii]